MLGDFSGHHPAPILPCHPVDRGAGLLWQGSLSPVGLRQRSCLGHSEPPVWVSGLVLRGPQLPCAEHTGSVSVKETGILRGFYNLKHQAESRAPGGQLAGRGEGMPGSQNSTRPPVSPGPLGTRGASCLAQNRPGWSGWLRGARIRKKDLFFIIQLVYPTHNKTGPDCSQMLDGAHERPHWTERSVQECTEPGKRGEGWEPAVRTWGWGPGRRCAEQLAPLERANPVFAVPALWSMTSPCMRVGVMCQLHWATAGGRREIVG